MNIVDHYVIKHQLLSADVIVAGKQNIGVLDHYIVYIGQCNKCGRHRFIGNMLEGVRWISEEEISDLLQKYELKRIRRFNGNTYQRQLACDRAKSKVGSSYSLFTYNCEHFANEVQNAYPESKQVQKGMALLGIGTFLLAAWGINSKS